MSKKIFTIVGLLAFLMPLKSFADPGDTTVVQAFTFGSPQDAVISFPDRWQLLMKKY